MRKRKKKKKKKKNKQKKKKKNEEKQQWFFLELQKQQEALFKSLSVNQPTDSTTIFTQNVVWNALETFSYAPDEDKTFEAYYRRYEDIYITNTVSHLDKAANATTQKIKKIKK